MALEGHYFDQPFAKHFLDRDISDPNASLMSGMNTTPTQDAIVEQFVSITCSTPDEAFFYLKFAKGNLQQAIESYFGNDGDYGETSNVLPPPPPRFSSPPPSGFLSPPPAPRKPPGDLDHEHDGDGASSHLQLVKRFLT